LPKHQEDPRKVGKVISPYGPVTRGMQFFLNDILEFMGEFPQEILCGLSVRNFVHSFRFLNRLSEISPQLG
jgi:hypothetical protein